ncbi:MAG: hypothetical protein Q8Q86_03605, partial [Candidatus Daviesbacteria bacterium]|nr:hypothetical protein [Candidatus Daviesbacteria bacterium]
MLLGASDTHWMSSPLPLALDPVGMAGCKLLVSPDALLPFVTSVGTSFWSIGIPDDYSMTMVPLFYQALVIDPGANVLGVTTSNA